MYTKLRTLLYEEKKKEETEKQEKEAFFKDLPIEDLEYLTNVCHSYNCLSNNFKNFTTFVQKIIHIYYPIKSRKKQGFSHNFTKF